MARKSKIDEDCEELSVVADPWNLKLRPTKLMSPFFLRCIQSWLWFPSAKSLVH